MRERKDTLRELLRDIRDIMKEIAFQLRRCNDRNLVRTKFRYIREK